MRKLNIEKIGRSCLCAIDGDAKDFDDAVYAESTSGYELYVAIADVSYYVQPGTMLDQQARIRGNSIYLQDLNANAAKR